jgi:hypothetical protein
MKQIIINNLELILINAQIHSHVRSLTIQDMNFKIVVIHVRY